MNRVLGLDISFYQNEPDTVRGVDFQKMKAGGDFVIIRAGQNIWPDPDFKFNWSESKKAGLPRGSYWYYDSRVNPKRQAEIWFELMNNDLGELPLFADFEEKFRGQFSGWRKWIDFMERLKELTGKKEIGIYTAYYYWTDNAPNSLTHSSNLEYFHQYPLWIANYGAEEPRVPKPWSKEEWLFWQFSELGNGKAFGVESSSIDLNYFNGELSEFKSRFLCSNPTPTPPPSPIPTHDINNPQQFRVTVPSLRIRQGPGLLFDTIGYLTLGDIVEEVGSTTDRTWLQIHRDGGLTGWCYSEYLVSIENPPSPVEPSPTIDYWYKVNSEEIPVHAEPASSSPVIGILVKEDCLPILGDVTDDGWGKIERIDGLSGWCKRNNFIPISQNYPELVCQRLHTGVMYFRKEILNPRKTVAHFINIFLRDDSYESLVTPADANGFLLTRTTSNFLKEFDMDIAINGDLYSYLGASRKKSQPEQSSADFVKPNGFAASRGTIYSMRRGPSLFVDEHAKASMILPENKKIYNAISGDRLLVESGKKVKDLPEDISGARSAIGLTKDKAVLILMVVDGRQAEISDGVTVGELADLMIDVGAWTALNLDGGGSSTLVIKGVDGNPRVVNSPIDKDIPGTERAVANHLGFKITKRAEKIPPLLKIFSRKKQRT